MPTKNEPLFIFARAYCHYHFIMINQHQIIITTMVYSLPVSVMLY